jgi:hypothetical protein
MREHIEKVREYIVKAHECSSSGQPIPEPEENLYESLLNCMVFLKHQGFKEEKEYRFCIFSFSKEQQLGRIRIRTKGGTLIPYMELFKGSDNLPIKAICVGPHPAKEGEPSLKAYLGSIGLDNVEVFCSDIPYIGSR